MSTKAKIFNFFAVKTDTVALNRARFEVLSKQIPLLYAILIANMLLLAYTHYTFASIAQTLILPICLSLISAYRTVLILRTDVSKLSDETIAKRLRSTIWLAGILGIIFISWALSLFDMGNAYTQGHVAFFICLTVIACVTCLMHLRQSAIILNMVVILPAVIFFASTDMVVFQAIALNMMLVCAAMMFVLLRYYNDFTDRIAKEQMLIEQGERLKILNEENRDQANRDSLTSLPNRRCFFGELDNMISERKGCETPFAVGILDLDGFKPVNDVFGHPTGDQLLIQTGERLKRLLDEDVILARLGGDEFGLIIPEFKSNVKLQNLGQQICEALQTPFKMSDGSALIAGTVGFASFPASGQTSAQLFERADYALCYAKQNNKGKVTLFSSEHETIIREVSTVSHRLREANLDEELRVMFQPIVDTTHYRATTFEALARWDNPVLGNISPEVFIRSAEQSGMINELTAILLEKTLNAVQAWPHEINVSFNLSAFDLNSSESALRLMRIIESSYIAPKRIIFEITESAMMQDFERTEETLHLLRSMGCSIALDDFGTGYSSLSHIQRMPVNRIKVDRSFISDIEQNQATQNIVRTIADLSRNLGLDCIVEGVENENQLATLHKMGYYLFQGYYFSKPLSAKDTLTYLKEQLMTQDKDKLSGTDHAMLPGIKLSA